MSKHAESTAAQGPDLTDRAYWSGTIKMSLSRFFILSVLYRQPMHGYGITRAVAQCTQGCCSPSEGSLYPALREFERGGYVTVRAEVVDGRQRKVYALTERGRQAFRVATEAWMEVTQALLASERLIEAADSQ